MLQVRAKVRRWKDRIKGKEFFKFSNNEIKKVKKLYKLGKSFAKEYSGKCNSIEMISDRPLLVPANDEKE